MNAEFEKQYYCYRRTVEDLRNHFKKMSVIYLKTEWNKQLFDKIVEAYKPILRGEREQLIAGLKRFGKTPIKKTIE